MRKNIRRIQHSKNKCSVNEKDKIGKIYLNEFILDDLIRFKHEVENFNELHIDHIEKFSNEYYIERTPGKSNYTDKEIFELYKAIEKLTIKQQDIVTGYLSGKTQQQVADILGLSQGSVSLSWHGSRDYKNGNPERYHGGIIKRLQKLMTKENK